MRYRTPARNQTHWSHLGEAWEWVYQRWLLLTWSTCWPTYKLKFYPSSVEFLIPSNWLLMYSTHFHFILQLKYSAFRFTIIIHVFLLFRPFLCTVQPCLSHTPEMWTSTIMQTLCLVRNATSIDLYIQSQPLARYSIKQTLDVAPTVSLPIQTDPDRGHFANKFVGSLVERKTRKS